MLQKDRRREGRVPGKSQGLKKDSKKKSSYRKRKPDEGGREERD